MQAHRLFYSPNRPLRVATATDIHRRCCQNCCQISKLLSNLTASEGAKLLGSRPRLRRPADARRRLDRDLHLDIVRAIRTECLDHLIVIDRRYLQALLNAFIAYSFSR